MSAADWMRPLAVVESAPWASMVTLPAWVAAMPPSVASPPARSVIPCPAAAEPMTFSAPPAVAVSAASACRLEAEPVTRSPCSVSSFRSPSNAATVPLRVMPLPALRVCVMPASMLPAASNVPCAVDVSVPAACARPAAPTATLRPVRVRFASLAAVPSTRASRAADSIMSPTDANAPAALTSRWACAVRVPAACNCAPCLAITSRPVTSKLPAPASPSAAAVPPRRASPDAASVRPPPATMTPSDARSAPDCAVRFCAACMRPVAPTRNCPPASAVRLPASAATVPSTPRLRCAVRLAGVPAVTRPVTKRSRAAWACSSPA
ncbi:hypothetical protein LMG26685_05204 [Achromobacter mucicolens]|nr:hypothetical protein LMG26685_05204 [Achromobacter mucicolens]